MTLREHLEAIRDGMAALPVQSTYRDNREARAHAIAALLILDEAERLGHLSQRIWPGDDRVAVPDPEQAA